MLVQRDFGSRSDVFALTNRTAVFGKVFVHDFHRYDFFTIAAVVGNIAAFRVEVFAFFSETCDIHEIVVVGSHAAE